MTNWPSSGGGGVFIFLNEGYTIMAGTKTTLPITGEPEKISEETILKIAKEITVKFIEVGRVTPTTFPSVFSCIYNSIDKTIRGDKP